MAPVTPNARADYARWCAIVTKPSDLRCLSASNQDPAGFLLSARAPVRGTLPCSAPCLPRRMSRTTRTAALNPDRHLRHPVTLYLGTFPDMSGPRGRSMADLCWIRQRELCLGSQVRRAHLCQVFLRKTTDWTWVHVLFVAHVMVQLMQQNSSDLQSWCLYCFFTNSFW